MSDPEGVGEPAPDREATVPPSRRVGELEERIEELEADLEDMRAEREDLEAQLQERTQTLAKVQADYENYRKRVAQEKAEARREARADLVDGLAQVLDDVDRALTADPSENVRKGLELLTRRVEDRLAAVDARRLEPEEGQAFDPQRHEVLMTVTTEEAEPDTIVELLQPGYALEDRIVRAARVKVAKAPDAEDSTA